MSDSGSESEIFEEADEGARLDTDTTSAHDSSSSSVAYTHDTSSSQHHIGAREWIATMNKAIKGAWPTRHIQYSQVVVLMLSWVDTDMPGTDDELKRLESVFEDAYGFTVSNWKIPSIDPDLETMKRVQTLVSDYGRPDNLLIVYYGGHARRGTEMGPIWQPKREPVHGQEINTAGIHTILGRAQESSPDVLLLYDCCNPLSAHRVNLQSTRAVVECLFAGGFESNVPVAGADSFTSALIDELVIAKNENISIPIPELHRRLIVRLQGGQKHAVFKNNKLRTNRTGESLVTKEVRITPQHLFLCESKDVRSISLRPMSAQDLKETQSTNRVIWPRVMMAVRLSSGENVQSEVANWLLKAPSSVIKLVVFEESFSNLLLFQTDVSIWDLLPPSLAMSFVGFVSGPSDSKSSAEQHLVVSSTTRAGNNTDPPYDSDHIKMLDSQSHPSYTPHRDYSLHRTTLEDAIKADPVQSTAFDLATKALAGLSDLEPPEIAPRDSPIKILETVREYRLVQHVFIEKLYIALQYMLTQSRRRYFSWDSNSRLQSGEDTGLRSEIQELGRLQLQVRQRKDGEYSSRTEYGFSAKGRQPFQDDDERAIVHMSDPYTSDLDLDDVD